MLFRIEFTRFFGQGFFFCYTQLRKNFINVHPMALKELSKEVA
jgi:hypothetical protein